MGNIHMHTIYSDGTGTHHDVAAAAARAGLDFVIVTDHNVHVGQFEGWHGGVLLLVGEEVHNPACESASHFLVLNAREGMAAYGDDPQRLINQVRARGGLGFIAHPFEHSGTFSREPEINWADWGVEGYTGLEIWNYMSEFKSYISDPLTALLAVLAPRLFIRGPYAETLHKWDELLAKQRVYAIGGSDAHANTYGMGPLKRQVFGYEKLFRAVNTHVFLPQPWSGESDQDAQMVYAALATGRSFVAYDALCPARGFRFTAEHRDDLYTLGDEFEATGAVRFRVQAPAGARLRLMQNGFCVAQTMGDELVHVSRAPGVYRVEAHRFDLFRWRGWIYSNPIFVRAPKRLSC